MDTLRPIVKRMSLYVVALLMLFPGTAMAANVDPLPTAVHAAETYWEHVQPCARHFTVRWEGPADYFPADMAAGWAEWSSPEGRGNESSPTQLRTECVAAIQTNDWTPEWWRQMYKPFMGEARHEAVVQYRMLCRIVTHELGHLIGLRHQFTNPHNVMYGKPLTLGVVDRPCDVVPKWVTGRDEVKMMPGNVIVR